MENRVELSKRAQKDLRKLGPGRVRDRLVAAIRDNLEADPMPDNADVKALQGAEPWLRLRCGNHRVIYRALTDVELEALDAEERAGFLVDRVVDRRELDRAIADL